MGEQSCLRAAHSGLVNLMFVELDDTECKESEPPNDGLYAFSELIGNGLKNHIS